MMSATGCPLFRSPRMTFCGDCTIELSEDYNQNLANLHTMVEECIANMNSIAEAITPDYIEEDLKPCVIEIASRLDRLANCRYTIGKRNKDAIRNILAKLDGTEKLLGAQGAKLCVNIGNSYFGFKNYEAAINWYNKAMRIDPKNKDALNNKGVAMARSSKLKNALKIYDAVVKLDPTYPQVWFNKGKAYVKLGQLKEALKSFEKTTEINPIDIRAWNNQGVVLRALGKYKEAIKCYDNAIEVEPNYEWSWHNKGVVLAELGKYEEAKKCFDKALEINPNFKPTKDTKELFEKKKEKKFLKFPSHILKH